jgi:hypothetical protein
MKEEAQPAAKAKGETPPEVTMAVRQDPISFL